MHGPLFVVADLPGGRVQQNRLSGLVANRVQLGAQAAFCPLQTTGKAPFAPCWLPFGAPSDASRRS